MDRDTLEKYSEIAEKNMEKRGYKLHEVSFMQCGTVMDDLAKGNQDTIYERVVRGREWIEHGQVNIEYGFGIKALGKKILSKMMNFRVWAVQNYYDEYLVNNQKLVEQLYTSLCDQQQECMRLKEKVEQLDMYIEKNEVQ